MESERAVHVYKSDTKQGTGKLIVSGAAASLMPSAQSKATTVFKLPRHGLGDGGYSG